MNDQIRAMHKNDWTEVSRIYQQGMDSNMATFETKCPEYDAFDYSHVKTCRFVSLADDKIAGWAALSTVSDRCVYGGVAEVSIYIDEDYRGKGIGTRLLNEIIAHSEKEGYWMLQAGIMQDNEASICLHKKCGFRMVGYRERIGRDRYGVWRNTVLMEKRKQQDSINECGCNCSM